MSTPSLLPPEPTPDVPPELQRAVWATQLCIANPFQVNPADYSAAAEFFEAHWKDVPDIANEFCERHLPDTGRRLLLAAGNWWAFIHHEKEARPLEQALLSAHGKEMGLTPLNLRRLIAAVERFYERIKHFDGVSEAVRSLRADAWTACFGRSLNDTLMLERTIRDQNVLILGETGTGKELLAETIQDGALGRADGMLPPKPAINGAAIPTELAESELFGHKRGSFTNALYERDGKIVEADEGTLFIDELADLPIPVQPKLLRVMETNLVTPVGSNRSIPTHVRYIGATSKPLKEMARSGEFRADLYERFAGVVLTIPPLRKRREDIEPIGRSVVQHRLADADPAMRDKVEATVIDWLRTEAHDRPWKGNVRELAAAISNQLLGISVQSVSEAPVSLDPRRANAPNGVPEAILRCEASDREVSDWYLRRVLEETDGNQSKAERILGIDRGTIRRRMDKLGLLKDPTPSSRSKTS